MRFTAHYRVSREDFARLEDWHLAAAADRCFRLTPGHRSVNWHRESPTIHLWGTVTVRLEAPDLATAAAAAERCVKRIALPYVVAVADVGPTRRVQT